MDNPVLGILATTLIGLVLAGVLVALWLRQTRRRLTGAAGLTCPECGGDLRGYDHPFTCPHCYAVLGEDEEEDEGASIDEESDDLNEDSEPLA